MYQCNIDANRRCSNGYDDAVLRLAHGIRPDREADNEESTKVQLRVHNQAAAQGLRGSSGNPNNSRFSHFRSFFANECSFTVAEGARRSER
jgi:hypothetical protein